MTLSEAIQTILTADSALTAVVPATRIVAGNAPQTTPNPCIVHSREGTSAEYDKDGSGIRDVQYDVAIFTSTHKQGEEICDLVRSALDLYKGSFTGFRIDRARFDGQRFDVFDPDNTVYQVTQGYLIKVFDE